MLSGKSKANESKIIDFRCAAIWFALEFRKADKEVVAMRIVLCAVVAMITVFPRSLNSKTGVPSPQGEKAKLDPRCVNWISKFNLTDVFIPYSGNGCTGKRTCWEQRETTNKNESLPITEGTKINFKKDDKENGCKNDEARSVMICNIDPSPTVQVRFFDNPNGHTDDDWVRITIEDTHQRGMWCIDTFEQTVDQPGYRQEYFAKDKSKNALDGKVSYYDVVKGKPPK